MKTEQELRDLFNQYFNCYADVDTQDVIPAMDVDQFIVMMKENSKDFADVVSSFEPTDEDIENTVCNYSEDGDCQNSFRDGILFYKNNIN